MKFFLTCFHSNNPFFLHYWDVFDYFDDVSGLSRGGKFPSVPCKSSFSLGPFLAVLDLLLHYKHLQTWELFGSHSHRVGGSEKQMCAGTVCG